MTERTLVCRLDETFSHSIYRVGASVVAKVAKTFGVARVNAESLGEFRYEFFTRMDNSSAIGRWPYQLYELK